MDSLYSMEDPLYIEIANICIDQNTSICFGMKLLECFKDNTLNYIWL